MRRLGGAMNTLRELRHTNLVSVMHFDRRAAAVVYEGVPGSTLTQVLEGQGQLELAASLVLLEDCISGLEALHNTGVIHGNLTTDAVVVETTGAVLLRDAGLSRSEPAAGVLLEQRPFLAPEILAGAAPTAATDLYAATAVFVESIGGRASKAAVRKDLRPLLAEGMAKDPSKRSATLDNFRHELDDYARATIGESWRRDGRALLTIAASAAATRALPVSAPARSSGDAADKATATVALLRSPGPRDPRIWVGLGALGFVALLAVLVLVRGLNGPTGLASGFGVIPSNFIPGGLGSSTPSPSPSAVAPAPVPGALTPGATVPAPIVGPAATPLPPTPKPNPALLSQTLTWTSTPPSGAAYNGSYTAAASGGASGNPVVFGSLTTAVCKPAVGNSFAFVGVGTCVIDATQAGNSRFNAARPIERSFPVGQASQTIGFTSNPTNPTYLGSYTVTATALGGSVTFSADPASVSCSVSGGTVSFNGVGTCIIDANQGGDADYTAAQQTQQQFDVAQASQTINFTSTPPTCPCTPGQQYTVTATGGGSGNAVTFNIDASSATGVCSISGSTVTIIGVLPPGACIIDAFQAGDSNYSAAPEVQQTINVS